MSTGYVEDFSVTEWDGWHRHLPRAAAFLVAPLDRECAGVPVARILAECPDGVSLWSEGYEPGEYGMEELVRHHHPQLSTAEIRREAALWELADAHLESELRDRFTRRCAALSRTEPRTFAQLYWFCRDLGLIEEFDGPGGEICVRPRAGRPNVLAVLSFTEREAVQERRIQAADRYEAQRRLVESLFVTPAGFRQVMAVSLGRIAARTGSPVAQARLVVDSMLREHGGFTCDQNVLTAPEHRILHLRRLTTPELLIDEHLAPG